MQNPGSKQYDLEERTLKFAQDVRVLGKRLKRTIANTEDLKQLIRASGSIGANYIEANEALGAKDFLMKLRISRKEAKETRYWLRLIDCSEESTSEKEREALLKEATELLLIFSAIINKSQNKMSI